jgi:hypothetical protein
MSAHRTDPLEELLHRIDREPPPRRAFWKALAEDLREHHARLPRPKRTRWRRSSRQDADALEPPRAAAADGTRLKAAEPMRRRKRRTALRVTLLIAALIAAPFVANGPPPAPR